MLSAARRISLARAWVALVLWALGYLLLWRFGGVPVALGVFLCQWANNIELDK